MDTLLNSTTTDILNSTTMDILNSTAIDILLNSTTMDLPLNSTKIHPTAEKPDVGMTGFSSKGEIKFSSCSGFDAMESEKPGSSVFLSILVVALVLHVLFFVLALPCMMYFDDGSFDTLDYLSLRSKMIIDNQRKMLRAKQQNNNNNHDLFWIQAIFNPWGRRGQSSPSAAVHPI